MLQRVQKGPQNPEHWPQAAAAPASTRGGGGQPCQRLGGWIDRSTAYAEARRLCNSSASAAVDGSNVEDCSCVTREKAADKRGC